MFGLGLFEILIVVGVLLVLVGTPLAIVALILALTNRQPRDRDP